MIEFVQHKVVKVLLLFSITILITFCTDDPTSIGDNLIPDGDKVLVLKVSSLDNNLDQTFSTFQKDSLFYGSSSRVLLGNYKNLSIEMLLGFGMILPDTTKEQLKKNEVILIKSWIEMKPNYWIGDSTQFSFSIHKINEAWTSVKFNNDDLTKIKTTMSNDVILSETYSFTDSIITLQIDQEVVNGWVERTYDKEKPENNGILFAPVSSTGIVGFQALSAFPTSNYITLKMVFEKQGSYIDTFKVTPSIDIHAVTSTLPIDPIGSSILQSASAVRGKLWFDVSEVPDNAIINKATLDLFIDSDNSIEVVINTDTVAVSFYEMATSGKIEVEKKYGKIALQNKEEQFSGDIRTFVQRWINGKPNEGLQIVLSDENRTASTIAFYNSNNAVDSLKPRLTLHYTKQK